MRINFLISLTQFILFVDLIIDNVFIKYLIVIDAYFQIEIVKINLIKPVFLV